jgi:hypothetical protein
LCKNSTQAICSENGKLIGVYPNKEVKKWKLLKDYWYFY